MGSNPTPRTSDKPYTQDIVNLLLEMKKDGYAESTIECYSHRLKFLAKRLNLNKPETVKEFIAKSKYSNGYKNNLVKAYNHYVTYKKLEWNEPHYQRAYSIKKLPLESDIDLVISYSKTRGRTAFKLIKECGLRPIEVSKLTMRHIDLRVSKLYPETAKGGEARVLKIKPDTLALLKELINKQNLDLNDTIFPCSKTLQKNWNRMRNRLAHRLAKPELKQIRLYDLRHYFGTMLYYKTKDIIHVQRKMGHRNIKNTLIYIDLVDFKDEEYTCKTAKNLEEFTNLVESGFEYISEIDGVKVFRKRK